MLLGELARVSGEVSATRKRTEKVALLAAYLERAAPEERALCTLYLAGQLGQAKLGVGAAQVSNLTATPASAQGGLRVLEVDAVFSDVAGVKGSGAVERRLNLLRDLFQRATGEEQHFLARLMLGELRQGALESLVLEALSRAARVPLEALRRAHMLAGELGTVARAAFDEGEAGLERYDLCLFRPVLPMLAEPARDVSDALSQLSRAAFEVKLDGARVQVHRSGSDVQVFSRSGQDVTAAVPEIRSLVAALPARELVLDGEVLALREDGRPRPFQETMRRFGRKLDVEAMRTTLPLSPFFFDSLYVDGQSLLDAPTEERARVLMDLVPTSARVPRLVTDELALAEAFLADALARGHEGLMAKALNAPYFAGRRGASWLKIKAAHTLDLVVLAAEWGSGRRTGMLSNLHLGARDAQHGGFVMLGKTFKGLTDQMLVAQTAELLARETRRDAYTVYVRPELVVEIAFNDVQTSSQYPGGVALRFARVRRYRPDKSALEADTLETVRAFGVGDREPV